MGESVVSFPRYPAYKDSGVEWLGYVPVDWAVKRIGYFFNERREKVSDKDYPALSVTKSGIVPQLDTAAKSDDSDNRKRVCKGDFVINSRSDRKGSAGASDLDGSVSLICTVMRPQETVHTPFVHHLLRSVPFQEEFYRNGKGIVADLWSTNYSEMRNILLGMPPLPEQTRIATFLDREAAKIDGLVAEQQRLIDLLKEKRQAVISHAVTKGLNPHAPLKPSGIEWLGDVPEHWMVLPLHRVVQERRRITYGIVQPGEPDPTGRFMVRGQDYSTGWSNPDSIFRVSDAIEVPYQRARLRSGDLVITIVGAGVGNIAVVPDWLDGANITQTTARIAVDPRKANPEFVAGVLQGPIGKRSVELYAKGAAQPGLNLEHVRIFPVTVPPIDEQRQIAAFIHRETSRLDALTAEAERGIELLQERRAALISAAVTGQIDVRGLAETEAA